MDRNDQSKPLQTVSWSHKVAKNYQWFHDNADYYISRSRFGAGASAYQAKLETLYGVYNNRYPSKWFNHITNPLNATNPRHKNFPAQVRPVNILRTNLDYLMNEFPLRPFHYHVTNLSPEAINVFEEALNHHLEQEVLKAYQQLHDQQGVIDPAELPNIEEARAEFQASYRDKLAINGQGWLERNLPLLRAPLQWNMMFKDWVLAGEVRSFKGYVGTRLVYERVSPLDLDYEASPDTPFVEDGEWVVRRKAMTISDIVDHFYGVLKPERLREMERKHCASPKNLSDYLTGDGGIIPEQKKYHSRDVRYVYHVQWKGKKKVWLVSEMDEVTGQIHEISYDEDHPLTPEQKANARAEYWNEVHECWKLGNDLYVMEGTPPVQRNEQTCASACKLAYNGRQFSDTHAENISLSEIGLPYQIMYMIINRTLELTIAKSKGKIIMFDKNAIPSDGDWDEEKFFYYSEALGWGLLDRNKIGVDKSYNQYQVIDMTLFESIKQLIDLQQHYKQEWDDIIGIPRQKRGQMMASDGKGTTEHSLNQASIVTDGTFRAFDEFREVELQGLVDFSKFDVATGGNRALYYDDLYQAKLLDINPDDYSMASLGILVESTGKTLRNLDLIRGQVGAYLQNQGKMSAAIEMLTETNVHKLKAKIKQVELIEAQMAQQNEELKAELEAQLIERQQMMEEFSSSLRIRETHEEYDRKEDLEVLKGAFNTFTFQDGDSNDNGVPDVAEVLKYTNDQEKIRTEKLRIAADLQDKRESRKVQQDMQAKDLAQREKESQRKLAADKAKARAQKKTSSNSKK